MVPCSVQTSQQHQHAEGWDEDRGNTREEEAAPPVSSSWVGAEEEEGEITVLTTIIYWSEFTWKNLLTHLPNIPSLQSIVELNRSSNGGSGSKRLSLDNSHLDSSRDTDSGTPFSSPSPIQPVSKAPKLTSDSEDRYQTPSGGTFFS